MKEKKEPYQIRWGIAIPCMIVGILGLQMLVDLGDDQISAGIESGLGGAVGIVLYIIGCKIIPPGWVPYEPTAPIQQNDNKPDDETDKSEPKAGEGGEQ